MFRSLPGQTCFAYINQPHQPLILDDHKTRVYRHVVRVFDDHNARVFRYVLRVGDGPHPFIITQHVLLEEHSHLYCACAVDDGSLRWVAGFAPLHR